MIPHAYPMIADLAVVDASGDWFRAMSHWRGRDLKGVEREVVFHNLRVMGGVPSRWIGEAVERSLAVFVASIGFPDPIMGGSSAFAASERWKPWPWGNVTVVSATVQRPGTVMEDVTVTVGVPIIAGASALRRATEAEVLEGVVALERHWVGLA